VSKSGGQLTNEISTVEEIKQWIKQYRDEWFDFTKMEIDQIENDWLRFSAALRHTEVVVLVGIRKQCIQCSAGYSGFEVPSDRRIEICELINRMNLVGMVSMATMNMDDGRIVWSAFLPFEESRCQSSQIKMILLQTLISADVSFPLIIDVLQNRKTPKEVIERKQREIYPT
jgi:hypothetical protein